MSGIEIFGVVAAAIGLTTGFFKAFGTRKNAPRQVDRLRRILDELRDPRLIEGADAPELARIADMVNRCTDLLQQHGPPDGIGGGGGGVGGPGQGMGGRRGSLFNKPWEFHWPADVEELLKTRNDEMDQELTRLTTRVYRAGKSSTWFDGGIHRLNRNIEDGGLILGPLHLHRVNILERDEETQTRTVLYETINSKRVAVMRVTHRIPRGTIRFEDEDLDDLSVSFLDSHDITVQNSEGYKIYHCHTVYDFRSKSNKEEFLCKMRERDLLGSFYCVRIERDGDVVGQSRVVRLWNKPSQALVTFAFLGRGGKQYELLLADFDRRPQVERKKVKLKNRERGVGMVFELRSPREASAMNQAFEASHPETWNVTRLAMQTPTSWLSTPELMSMAPSSSAPASSVASSAASIMTTSGSSAYMTDGTTVSSYKPDGRK